MRLLRRRERETTNRIRFKDGEWLEVNSTEYGLCSTCRLPQRELLAALEMTVEAHGEQIDLIFCRDCIGRSAPRLLAALEDGTVVA